eukprot:UN16657
MKTRENVLFPNVSNHTSFFFLRKSSDNNISISPWKSTITCDKISLVGSKSRQFG